MADNVVLNSGSGGATVKTDDDGTAHWQYVKLAYGADNTQTRVTTAAPLPVDLRADNLSGNLDVNVATSLPAGTNAIGKLAANSGVDIGDVDVTSLDGVAAEGAALGNGILLQGDDGTDRKNINVDATTGDVQVDVTNTVTVGSHDVTNAGTFAVQVDGDALTSLQTIDNIVQTEDSVHGSGDSGVMALGVRQDTQSDFGADGDYVPLSIDADGAVRVNAINAGGTSNVDTAAGGTDEGAVLLAVRDDSLTTLTPADGDYVNLRVNSTGALHVTGGGGGTEYNEDDATPATITGTATVMERDDALSSLTPIEGDWAAMRCSAEGALWVQEFNSDAILADTANMDTNLGTVAGAVSGTEMQVDVVASLPAGDNNIGNVDIASALPAGTNAIGKLAANSGVDIGDVDVTSIAAGSNLIGNVGIGVRTSGGTTIFRSLDLDESEEEVKGTAGQVYWIHAINVGTAVRYLKFYNAAAASVTVGTTTPVLTFPVPTQNASANAAGFVLSIPMGIEFDTGITVAATTGIADNDTGAPGANEVIVNIGYA